MSNLVSPSSYTECIRVLRCSCGHGWIVRDDRLKDSINAPRHSERSGHRKKRGAVRAAKSIARTHGVRVVIHRADGAVDRHDTTPEE